MARKKKKSAAQINEEFEAALFGDEAAPTADDAAKAEPEDGAADGARDEEPRAIAEGDAAAPEDPAADPDLPRASYPRVYVGPSLNRLGVFHGTVFSGDLPKAFADAAEEMPEILGLIVPAASASSAMREMERKGSLLHERRARLLIANR